MHEDQDRETLLEQLQWTRRVAAGMVESAGIADDVVQETWLRVLEHPPRDPSRRRGWLARIARNAARQHWRRARRRDDVEHVRAVEAEPASEATVELVARAQAQEVLARAVLALAPEQRDVVLLRYYEELDSRAIAERLEIPASTVRTRLQRALQILRERLSGRDAADWLGAVIPLLPRPSAPASPANASPVTTAGSSSAAAWPLAVTAGLVTCLVAAVLLDSKSNEDPRALAPWNGGTTGSAQSASVRAPADERPSPARVLREETPADEERSTNATERADSQPAAPRPEPPTPELVVEVRVDGEPAASGWVHLSAEGFGESGGRWIDADRGARSGAAPIPVGQRGRARFENVAALSGSVGYARSPGAGVVQRSFRREDTSEVVVLETGTARLDGRVFDADGRPAADVEVSLGMRLGYDYGALGAKVRSDARGRFVFDGLLGTDFWVHMDATDVPGTTDGLRETRVNGRLERGETREIRLGGPAGDAGARAARLSGFVVDARGRPIRSPEPHLGRRLQFRRVDAEGGTRTYSMTTLSADGAYAIELDPGTYAVRRMNEDRQSVQLVAAELRVRERDA